MTDADDTPTEAPEPEATDETELDAYDLDGDGEISVLEAERARLGLVDARLEEIAEHGGITGAIADVVHKVVDKLDND
ncbi:MAG: hypothetical protein Q8M22_05230 [Actinomycetota bacterium]|nr:hypothetical protein [Actinomycetota bacterium]